MNKSRPAAPQSRPTTTTSAQSPPRGLSESLRRGERHEQIEASSASEASYYYNIVAVATSSVGRVRGFGVASAMNKSRPAAPPQSSYYYNIGAVAASWAE
ncbi:hypothetical protein PR001_g33280 [Phytophthora rubi]|uniref:Uncharacterized protein n=1 Tax=Phytophthora rubi TaxID=129364 RepID=A0A6A3G6I0_9STRA|nr:hypothetical protein PR001_g33280 [Phytophthora rubi]